MYFVCSCILCLGAGPFYVRVNGTPRFKVHPGPSTYTNESATGLHGRILSEDVATAWAKLLEDFPLPVRVISDHVGWTSLNICIAGDVAIKDLQKCSAFVYGILMHNKLMEVNEIPELPEFHVVKKHRCLKQSP